MKEWHGLKHYVGRRYHRPTWLGSRERDRRTWGRGTVCSPDEPTQTKQEQLEAVSLEVMARELRIGIPKSMGV